MPDDKTLIVFVCEHVLFYAIFHKNNYFCSL